MSSSIKVPIDLHIHIALRVDVAGADAVYRVVASAVEREGHPGIESFVNELAPWLRVAKVDNKTSSRALNVYLDNAVEDAVNKEIGIALYYEMYSDLSDDRVHAAVGEALHITPVPQRLNEFLREIGR
jgi:hypothetical protein